MGNQTELARRMKRQQTARSYEIGTVVRLTPLTFSLCGGDIMLTDARMRKTSAGAARAWELGDEAIFLLGGDRPLLLDKVV